MDQPLKPFTERVLMRRKVIKKIGSILVSEDSQETRIGIAEVIAKGPSCKRVKVGDLVYFGRYATVTVNPTELEWNGINMPDTEEYEYLFTNEKDLISKVEKPALKAVSNG